LPALDVGLRHESEIGQSDNVRKVAFEIRGRAIGPLTEALARAQLGVEHAFQGFLGAQRNGRGIVFHIQTIELK
jgi:primosomal replication protein N